MVAHINGIQTTFTIPDTAIVQSFRRVVDMQQTKFFIFNTIHIVHSPQRTSGALTVLLTTLWIAISLLYRSGGWELWSR